jgi:probable Rubsico expression protein CbbX
MLGFTTSLQAVSLRSRTPALTRVAHSRQRGVAAPASFRLRADERSDYEQPQERRLSDALKERDVEARLAREEAERRDRERREARLQRQRKVEEMLSIPDEKEAGTIDEFLQKEGVLDILQKLDHDLVGLKPVKERVREIAALLVIDKLRSRLGLTGTTPTLHMAFTGSPGTGKTTVAMRMGQILKAMGYCRSGHLIVATRDDLVGQYVGHTAPKTKEVIKRAFGGVLFIDEAYYLYNAANDRDYGVEAIEILLNVMEEQREDLVVILAGYEDRMNKFYSYIPGISSRIGNHINFPDYKLDELVDIAKVMVRDMEYRIAEEALPACRDYIEKRMQMPYFSNARTVRNLINRARMRSAIRIFNKAMDSSSDGMVDRDDLMTLIPEDFPTVKELEERGDTAIVE